MKPGLLLARLVQLHFWVAVFSCPINSLAANTWSYRQQTDRTSNQTYSIAQSPIPRLDLYDELKLAVICKDGKLQAQLEAASISASQGSKFELEYQIDKQPSVNIPMRAFSDSKRRGYTDIEANRMVADMLSGHEAIVLRVKTMIKKVLSASIHLPDAEQPIQQVLSDCGTTPTQPKQTEFSLADFGQAFNKLSKEQQQQVLQQLKKILMELP